MTREKVHYIGSYGRSQRLWAMARDVSGFAYIEVHEMWTVTGSANIEEARRRVARVKAGAQDDPGVRQIK